MIIGVHSKSGAEKMPGFVKEKKIAYPVAVDTKGATVKAYHVDGYPDYHIIDRSGKVRVADLANAGLDKVIKALLAEKAPPAKKPGEAKVEDTEETSESD